jgi:hypothetical protein
VAGARRTPASPQVAPALACDTNTAVQIVTRYIDAFNAGDQATLDRLFAPMLGRYSFEWYSSTEDTPGSPDFRHINVELRQHLLAYFAERHQHGERLQLRDVGLTAAPTDPRRGERLFTLRRTADDIPPALGGPDHLATGKGTIDCGTRTIMVWSMIMLPGGAASHAAATPATPPAR